LLWFLGQRLLRHSLRTDIITVTIITTPTIVPHSLGTEARRRGETMVSPLCFSASLIELTRLP
jgi:hypothetical protein